MKISALASGSSGNCFFIENEGKAILVDAGISAKSIINRLAEIKRSPDQIKGIFITHEHTDHIRGADVFARTFNLPIFATKKTIDASFLCSNQDLINSIKNSETVKLAGMEIEAFPKSHEAADPVSFTVTQKKRVSIITDAGHACKQVVDHVANADSLILESNHDELMLKEGPYPYFLKKWIAGDTGHLSNRQASLCVLEHAKHSLQHLILAHLSQNNNTPKQALKTAKFLLRERLHFAPYVTLSLRDEPTSLLSV